ncbi:MAG TPA: hypothetical protein VLB84_18275, partial [Bacteroidia bacterium]|nr:hypothetical protein [Bacteroidia bacterium]
MLLSAPAPTLNVLSILPFEFSLTILCVRASSPSDFAWRRAPYEFVSDRPAIDLLTGGTECREAIESGDRDALDRWIGSWPADEEAFRAERRDALIYPETG